MKLKRTFSAILLILMLSTGVNVAIATPPASIIQRAKAQIEAIRYQLPVEAYPGLMLTNVSYDSKNYTLVYKYQYTVQIQKPTPTAINEARMGIVHMVKANPNSEDMRFLKSGITFLYKYYNADGSYLYSSKISPSDVR